MKTFNLLIFVIVLSTFCGNSIAYSQVGTRVLEKPFNLEENEEIEVLDYLNHIWVIAADSIYKVGQDKVSQLNNYCKEDSSKCESNSLNVKSIYNGKYYFGTEQGLFELQEDSFVQQFNNLRGKSVSELYTFGNYLWFKSSEGIGFSAKRHGGCWESTKYGKIINYFNKYVWIATGNYYHSDELIRIENNGQLNNNSQFITFLDPNRGLVEEGKYEREIYEIDSINGKIWISASDGLYILEDTIAHWFCQTPAAIAKQNSSVYYYLEDRIIEHTLAYLKYSNKAVPNIYGINRETQFFHQVIYNLATFANTPSSIDSILQLSVSEKMNFSQKLFSYSPSSMVFQESNNNVQAKTKNSKPLAFKPSETIGFDSVDISQQHSFGEFVWDALRKSEDSYYKEGVYLLKYEEGLLYKVPNVNSTLRNFEILDDSLNTGFFVTTEGVFYVKSDTIILISNLIFQNFEILGKDSWGELNTSNYSDVIWINTDKGLFEFVNQKLKLVFDKEIFEIESIISVKEQIDYFFTNKGIFSIDKKGKIFKHIDKSIEWTQAPIEFDSLTWVISNIGPILLDKSYAKRVPNLSLKVNSIQYINDLYWLSTIDEVYKVDPNMVIKCDLVQKQSTWKKIANILLSKNTLISGLVKPEIYYYNQKTNEKIRSGEFDFIIESDENSFTEKLENNRFSAEGTTIEITTGIHQYRFALKDKYGNLFIYPKDFSILPAEYLLPVIFILIWLVILFTIIFLAPYSSFAHSLLMNPWVRNISSFGLFPLLISLSPFLRNHILSRYLKNMCDDPEITRSLANFVLPSPDLDFDTFLKNILEERKLILIGQSGIGKTTYFHYLTFCFSKQKLKRRFSNLPIPVFIPLSRYTDESPEQIFLSQMHKYGSISDYKLSEWFLKQGHFIIFFDGLNEVTPESRNKINSFADKYWIKNIICLSSQIRYDEFSWIKKSQFIGLDRTRILEIIKKHLVDSSKYEKQLNADSISIYENPQNLMFGIELLKKGQQLPQTNFELFSKIFKPIKADWETNNHTDNFPFLTHRAFKMLNSREHFIDSEDEIEDSIINTLLDKKLLLKRNGKHQFRHDLIKAFLASNYFAANVEAVFEIDSLKIDENWFSCLLFLLYQLDEFEQVRYILFELLERDRKIASYFFKSIRDNKQNINIDKLSKEFLPLYGEYSLE
jgi:hypothetical protein